MHFHSRPHSLEDSTLKRRQLMFALNGIDEEQMCERLAEEEWISEDSLKELASNVEKEELLLSEMHLVQEALEKITDQGQLWRLL
jgi:hypothetical protein